MSIDNEAPSSVRPREPGTESLRTIEAEDDLGPSSEERRLPGWVVPAVIVFWGGFLGAMAVELAQGLLLPGRQASFSDVVANGAGALLGALLAKALSGVATGPEPPR